MLGDAAFAATAGSFPPPAAGAATDAGAAVAAVVVEAAAAVAAAVAGAAAVATASAAAAATPAELSWAADAGVADAWPPAPADATSGLLASAFFLPPSQPRILVELALLETREGTQLSGRGLKFLSAETSSELEPALYTRTG